MAENFAIEMEHISKSFPGIKANDDITLRLKKGEIHALLGENGAGKSTLMSILFGLYSADEGTIKVNGKEVEIKDPNYANDLGIGMVHQHFKLVDVFTLLENIILGSEPVKFKFLLNKAKAREKIKSISDKYQLDVDLDAKVEDVSVGMQQKTEIIKMLYRDNDILIFDEPTAVLTPQEIKELLEIMKNLAAEGRSILFISHKLDEIMAVANTCSVLRKGKLVATLDVNKTNMALHKEVKKQTSALSDKFHIANEFKNNINSNNINRILYYVDKMKEIEDEKYHHENLAEKVIKSDNFANILKEKFKITDDDIDTICRIINGTNNKKEYFILAKIIKSNFDADQLDYMIRDTKNTGINVNVDLDYIINNMYVCKREFSGIKREVICYTAKAVSAIEQFLLSKYYWYSNILFYEKAYIVNYIARRIYSFLLTKNQLFL